MAELHDWGEPYLQYGTFAVVAPDCKNLGLGTLLNVWAETLARKRIGRASDGLRVSLFSRIVEGDNSSEKLLASLGYAPTRCFLLMAKALDEIIVESSLPQGAEITSFAEGCQNDRAFRSLFSAVRDAFRDHWGYVEAPFEAEYNSWRQELLADPAFDPTTWFVVSKNKEIVGFALCSAHAAGNSKTAKIEDFGVVRQWRRHGVARALLCHVLRNFKNRGMQQVELEVDSDSPTGAIGLYETAGMQIVQKTQILEKILRPGDHKKPGALGNAEQR